MRSTFTLSLILSLSVITTFGQTAVEKTFQLQGSKELGINFDHPNVVLQTWDKNEILVKGTVSINNGENDSAFELQSSVANGVLSITSVIKDKENLPRHVAIMKDGKEYVFKANSVNDPEVRKFLSENGNQYTYISTSLNIKIDLQVFVPRNLKTSIDMNNGIAEFKSFDAPLRLISKNGKVDATIPSTIGSLTARTKNGEILSNLDFKFDELPWNTESRDKWTQVTAHPGKGQEYYIEAKNGTVYLRKP